jgi:cytochrome c551/c552
MKNLNTYILALVVIALSFQLLAQSDKSVEENLYYRMSTVPVPEGILIEGGGVTILPDGAVAVCTRRGDVWIVENPTQKNGERAVFRKFASGLHEPLGLLFKDNALYTAQRGELTKLQDTDGDRVADVYETIYSWPLSTHYHEYSFGPKLAPDGGMFVTANVAFDNEEWWRGESRVPWRGWTLKIYEDGTMEPWATGMRSPCGIGMIDGEFFYTDNQGDWIGSGGLWHVSKGSFTGHPAGLRWTGSDNSPVNISEEDFYAKIDKRQVKKDGRYVKPANINNEENPDLFFELQEEFPEIKLPAVWLPHGILGISNTEVIVDETNGKFGPFEGQVFIGDQGQSKIMRVVLEKVNGEYQGVAFDFRSGFQSGVLRMAWNNDGDLFAGETNRGWGSAGSKNSGLEYITWTGRMPFEMKTVSARTDGFEITFTKPLDKETANNLESYNGKSFVYKYHPVYGSPQINIEPVKYMGVKVSTDGMSVRVVVDNLRQYYVHELNVYGLRSVDGDPILHPTAFYTLNNIPEGDGLPVNEWTNNGMASTVKKPVAKKTVIVTPKKSAAPTYAEIEPLLAKNTCTACHSVNQRLVGPAFEVIAKRDYTAEKMVELIYNPQPKNWPEYATPMAPMPQVDKSEALKIARWINSLK